MPQPYATPSPALHLSSFLPSPSKQASKPTGCSLLLLPEQTIQVVLPLLCQAAVVFLALVRQAYVRIVAHGALPFLIGLRARELVGRGAEDIGCAATTDMDLVI